MNSGVRNLIALQDVEQRVAGLQKQISEIPSKIQNLQEELHRLKQTHAQRITHNQELSKRRRAYEGQVDMLRAKLSKLKDQLMSVKTNKEYTALLHEIQLAESQIRSEEDKILEIMEEAEILESELKVAEKDLDATCAGFLGEIHKHEISIPSLEAEVVKLQQEKETLEAQVDKDLLEHYRRIAEGRKGIAMAEAKDELCTGCHVRIRPQVYADLLQTDNIHTCDSCSRILFQRESL